MQNPGAQVNQGRKESSGGEHSKRLERSYYFIQDVALPALGRFLLRKSLRIVDIYIYFTFCCVAFMQFHNHIIRFSTIT